MELRNRMKIKLNALDLEEVLLEILKYVPSVQLKKCQLVNKHWERVAKRAMRKRTNWEPNYKDRKWFNREASRCQFCNKMYKHPAHASMCITGHELLRCYLCFKICRNTEKLFDHFKMGHQPSARDKCLVCPYCEQSIPFKSVSCHVISMHLSARYNRSKPKSPYAKPKGKGPRANANANS